MKTITRNVLGLRRGMRGTLLALVACGLGAAPAAAQTIKMATLVPDGSAWHRILKEMADEWRTLSGGRVRVILYPGGVAGDDPDVVRKMRLGVLQAGVLTAVGIAEVDRSVYALGVPMMYRDYDEVYAVLDKMKPTLEASIDQQGFVMLNWADGGWVRFFTTEPVAVPDDLKKIKLFTWQGDTKAVELWKSGGFNPIPLPATEIATALQTGLVTGLGVSPQVAVISQYFTTANHMTDLDWQLLYGGTVIKKDVWEKLPADLRPALLASAQKAGEKLRSEIRANGPRDIEAMKKRGLTVVPVDAKAEKLWQQEAEGFYPKIRGEIIPAEAFDMALRFRDEYRKTKKAASSR
jgi:TRAP-type C4-dicarboxylate transport system substrate-binding protein